MIPPDCAGVAAKSAEIKSNAAFQAMRAASLSPLRVV